MLLPSRPAVGRWPFGAGEKSELGLRVYVRMRDRVTAVTMGPFGQFGRHEMQVSVADAGLGHSPLCKPAHVVCMAFYDGDLQAVLVIEMDVKR